MGVLGRCLFQWDLCRLPDAHTSLVPIFQRARGGRARRGFVPRSPLASAERDSALHLPAAASQLQPALPPLPRGGRGALGAEARPVSLASSGITFFLYSDALALTPQFLVLAWGPFALTVSLACRPVASSSLLLLLTWCRCFREALPDHPPSGRDRPSDMLSTSAFLSDRYNPYLRSVCLPSSLACCIPTDSLRACNTSRVLLHLRPWK